MGFTYSGEFASTPANIVADIKAKILVSTDWSNPTGQILQATCPNGAKLVIDLVGGGAADNSRIRPKFYRDYSAGAGVDGYQRSLYWIRGGSGGGAITTTSPLHVKVVAGNTLLYIEIEGPRAGEVGADSATLGSFRQCLFVAQLTPYIGSDTVPCVVAGGSFSTPGVEAYGTTSYSSYISQSVAVSRNQDNSASWVQAQLYTLCVPAYSDQATLGPPVWSAVAKDGSTYLFPYVVVEDTDGMRGRLTDLFYAGWANVTPSSSVQSPNSVNQVVTLGGNTYRTTAPYKGDGSNNGSSFGSLGVTGNRNSSQSTSSPLIAVRTA